MDNADSAMSSMEWEDVLSSSNDVIDRIAGIDNAACWDPVVLEGLFPEAWKQGANEARQLKQVRRVQDISLGLVDDTDLAAAAAAASVSREDFASTKREWPFDSSPCRIFGGKNTKKQQDAANEEINRRLFGPTFISKKHPSFGEFEEIPYELSKDATMPELISRSASQFGTVTAAKREHKDQQHRRDFKRHRSCGDIQEKSARESTRIETRMSSGVLESQTIGTPLKSKSEHLSARCRYPPTEHAMSTKIIEHPGEYHAHKTRDPLDLAPAAIVAPASATTRTYGVQSYHQPRRRRRPVRQVSEKECGEASPSGYLEKSGSVSSAATSKGRDLIEVLRKGESATIEDLQDVDNRRFLHSVIYKHTNGFGFTQLRERVLLELKSDPLQALQRKSPPLYVAPP